MSSHIVKGITEDRVASSLIGEAVIEKADNPYLLLRRVSRPERGGDSNLPVLPAIFELISVLVDTKKNLKEFFASMAFHGLMTLVRASEKEDETTDVFVFAEIHESMNLADRPLRLCVTKIRQTACVSLVVLARPSPSPGSRSRLLLEREDLWNDVSHIPPRPVRKLLHSDSHHFIYPSLTCLAGSNREPMFASRRKLATCLEDQLREFQIASSVAKHSPFPPQTRLCLPCVLSFGITGPRISSCSIAPPMTLMPLHTKLPQNFF